MANENKNTAKATSTPANAATPKVQTPPTPPAQATASPTTTVTSTTPGAPAAADKAPKAPKVKKPLYFDTEEQAKTEAAARTEGARRPFKVEFNGKVHYLVVHNWEQAVANVAKDHGGATFSELGKEAKVKENVTGASIAAMLEKLSETDRKQVEEALAKLKAPTA